MLIFILHQCYLTNHSATLATLMPGTPGHLLPYQQRWHSGPASPQSRSIMRSLGQFLLGSHPLGPLVIMATGMTPSRNGNSGPGPQEA